MIIETPSGRSWDTTREVYFKAYHSDDLGIINLKGFVKSWEARRNNETFLIITVGPVNWCIEEERVSYFDPAIDHPAHYGGIDDPYEVIKVVEAWGLDFCLGNVLKYIGRAGKKDPAKLKEDLEKAKWYLERKLSKL